MVIHTQIAINLLILPRKIQYFLTMFNEENIEVILHIKTAIMFKIN